MKKGDAVYGVCHGANLVSPESQIPPRVVNNLCLELRRKRRFAEYALVRDGRIAKIPERMTFEEIATLYVGVTSVDGRQYFLLLTGKRKWGTE